MHSFDRADTQIRSQTPSREQESKSNKIYSLMPDLMTGWKPKNIKIPSPILIKYKSLLTQQLLDYYKSQLKKIVYLGPRFTNSFKFHQQIARNYNLKYGITSEDIPIYLQKQLGIEQEEQNKHQPFQGMNPTFENSVIFDSQFESGNLDMVSQNQYNLFLRPDTNTCGHMQWFYFTVKNKNKLKIKFNICNNKKAKTLYERGMKPYVLSKYLKQNKGQTWEQAGDNLTYSRLVLKEQNQQKIVNQQTKKIGVFYNLFCLSFEYQFEFDNDQVSFAYCPPYTFSQLKYFITDLKKKCNGYQSIVNQQKFCSSLSGLDIPILTITDPGNQNQQKLCIVATGRIHPGQSNSSYIVEGLINYLVSEQARQMRKKVVFKIIPMINPDGVIFGNYRTSLSGKDLNRQFRTKNQQLIPEVCELKNLVKKLKYESHSKVMYYLDFHGHSLKKNVFVYGPQYDIWSIKYEKAKVLPKIMASKSQTFRMKSCLFKVATFKRTTARAFMLTYIPFCYTIQSSVGLYRNLKQEDHTFNVKKWREVGYDISESLSEIVAKMVENTNNAIKRKQKKSQKDQSFQLNSSSKQNDIQAMQRLTQKSISNMHSKKYLNPIRNLKKKIFQEPKQMVKIEEEECESDRFSEGNSDCQSDDNDLPKIQYQRLKEKIVNLIDTFQILMIGKKKHNPSLQKKNRKVIKTKKMRQQRKRSTEQMILVPSLKHRLGKIAMSQKKISLINNYANMDNSLHHFRGHRLNKLKEND